MAEEANFGVRRLRQAIENQATCGSGQFELSIDSADRLCREIEDELSRLSWAQGVPAPVDADGEVVPLTTQVMYTDKGETVRVGDIRFNGCLWSIRVLDSGKLYWVGALHCTEHDSWKKLEKDIRNAENGDACGYYGIGTAPCNEGCPGYKDLETSCAAIAMKDVLLRAKALAERDAKGFAPQPSPHGAKGAE